MYTVNKKTRDLIIKLRELELQLSYAHMDLALEKMKKVNEKKVDEKKVDVKKSDTRNEKVGDFVRKLIEQGYKNKEIVTMVADHYGNNNTTYACVAWYRNKMKD